MYENKLSLLFYLYVRLYNTEESESATLKISVLDPQHFGTDTDPDQRIRTSE